MATITTRVQGDSPKGSPLTNAEVDNNFINLNTAKYESGDAASFTKLELTSLGSLPTTGMVLHTNNYAYLNGGTNGLILSNASNGNEFVRYTDGTIVYNENSDDRDLRVESNTETHMLFVDGGDNRIGIGTSTPRDTLDVKGPIIAGKNSATGGSIILAHRYGTDPVATGDYLGVISGYYSTGQMVIGYGLRGPETLTEYNDSNPFFSTYDNFAGGKSAIVLGQTEIGFNFSSQSDTHTVGTSVGTRKNLSVSRTGIVINEDSKDVDFRVESDSNANMLFVDAAANAVGIGTSSPSEALHINAGNLSVDGSIYRREYLSIPGSTTRYIDVDITGSYGLYEIMVTGYGSSGSGNFFVHWTDGGHGGGNTYHRVNLISRNTQTNNPLIGELKKTSYGAYIKITNQSSNALTCHCITRSYNSSGIACEVSLETTEPTAVQTINTFMVDEPSSRIYIGQDGARNNAKVTVKSNATGQALSLQVQNDAYSLIQGWNAAGSNRFQVTGAGAITSFQGGAIFNENSDDASDFRVESDANTHAIFVDASADLVGINESSPLGKLHVTQGGNGTVLHLENTTGGTGATTSLDFSTYSHTQNNWANPGARISAIDDGSFGSNLLFYGKRAAINGALDERFKIGAKTEAVFNEPGNDYDFRVESDSNSNAILLTKQVSDEILFFGANSTNANTSQNAYFNLSDMHFYVAGENRTVAYFNRNAGSGSADGDVIVIRRNNVEAGSISVSSAGTTYNTTSDRRLKENIETITDGTDKLMAMNPVTHTWKAAPEDPPVIGFIAQEMQEIVPEAVVGEPDGEEMMSMDYGRITPVLVAALQDAHKKIAELEARLNILEGN